MKLTMRTTCEKDRYLQQLLESAAAHDEAIKKTTIYEKMHGHDPRVLNGLRAKEDATRNSCVQALRVFSDFIGVERSTTHTGRDG
jgi:hypothetical protein